MLHIPLSDQLRRAIDTSGKSRYAVCKAAGLDQAAVSRFMSGKAGLRISALDAIGEVLGLKITARNLPRRGRFSALVRNKCAEPTLKISEISRSSVAGRQGRVGSHP